MSPITAQEAWDATNPEDSTDVREESARRIMAGVAANDRYWDSRPELEALRAAAEGHGVVTRGSDTPTAVAGSTDPAAGSIEGSAEDVPPESLTAGSATPGAPAAAPAGTPAAGDQSAATTTTDPQAADKLRQQLRDAGINPGA